MMKRNSDRLRHASLPAVILVSILILTLVVGASTRASEAEVATGAEEYPYAMSWKRVEKLQAEDKYAAAAEVVEEILQRSIAAAQDDEWTRALVRKVQLRSALHGYETAVRDLQEYPWPESSDHRAVLELFYAHGLLTYLRGYSWEIGQRERVEVDDELDLERWTQDQIYAEAQRAFYRVWKTRDSWGDRSLGTLAEYLDQNDYPARIRGTQRDAVTYMWVELLADSGLWQARHSNQIYRLDRDLLIQRGRVLDALEQLEDPRLHPLVKLTALLDELERWHLEADRPEAAFEARLQRLLLLHRALEQEDDRSAIRAALSEALVDLGPGYEWWSMGQAVLAEMVQQEDAADSLIRAREIALAGQASHPSSVGSQRCRHIVASIEAPAYEMESMQNDSPGRRSILIQHKNLGALHFRAFRLDLLDQIETSRDYNLLPGYQDVSAIFEGRLPDAEWSIELPDTADFSMHRTFVTPPMSEPGMYVVVASVRRNFAENDNRMVAINLLVGDLVLLTQNSASGFVVGVRSGRSGRALEGVEVMLYRYDYRRGHRRVATAWTDASGQVELAGDGRQQDRYFVVARREGEVGLDANALWRLSGVPQSRTAALIYTDRSVYRPQQRLHWKVVSYRVEEQGESGVLPAQHLQVDLLDANHQLVESMEVETNDFGAASGQFEIPAGRLLGRWHLQTSLGGTASVRVEEYKRPTFEVTILEPETALRLNRSAELRGEARYYFGLPVVDAEVAWQVERVPVFPRWWWNRGVEPVRPETVATGTSITDADGAFEVSFLPQADERDAADGGVSYQFRLSVDLVDDGGETRSAQSVFNLGFVAVQATLDTGKGFFQEEEPATITIRRSDLDGHPRAGVGEWTLASLRSPDRTLLPAEQPLPQPSEESRRFTTPGDARRPRWATAHDPHRILGGWQAAAPIVAQEAEHDAQGLAEIDLGLLRGGAYRLTYRTRDDFGAVFESQVEFIVAAAFAEPIALPLLLAIEQQAVSVGDTARVLVQSGLAEQPMVLEVFRQGQQIDRRELHSQDGVQVIEIPIGSEDRGGLGVRLTAVRDHQLMTYTEAVFVPWEDRQLDLRFSSFRDLLRPGQRETWRVEVANWQGDMLGGGAAELLAYMYDRSLDIFAPHQPPDVVSVYPIRTSVSALQVNLGGQGEIWSDGSGFGSLPGYEHLRGDRLIFFDGSGIGGPGMRGLHVMRLASAMAPPMADMAIEEGMSLEAGEEVGEASPPPASAGLDEVEPASDPSSTPRTDFSETAFWEPHLLIDADGTVAFEFTVPDSVTEWNVWVHAVTRDLRGASLHAQSRSAKDLIVRPYLPRFLREGDRAELRVMVNNTSNVELQGDLDLEIRDLMTGEGLLEQFGLSGGETTGVPFVVAAGGSSVVEFGLSVPVRVGEVAIEVRARAGEWSDGEVRSLPLLPGRMHLSQSRFAALRDRDRRELHFADMAQDEDPTLLHEQLVVTLDAQLFYGVLQALPYLTSFPYECTEQTLNRFLSTGIVTSMYGEDPSVASMAAEWSRRETQYQTWDGTDPNRTMSLVETPWLRAARGGAAGAEDLLNVLDPRIAEAERRAALAALAKAQTSLGGFPWWPGGPPSPYMTLYLLHGFSRALEFDLEIPRSMVVDAWRYMHRHYIDEMVQSMIGDDCCLETITFLNYVLSGYPDTSWTGEVFSQAERDQMLDFSYRRWRQHSPLLKSYLALTLQRSGRSEDAHLVFDSVMDSSRTTRDEGTFWAPEDRSWLWYNDTIETHAFALRTLTEIDPRDDRRHGLVQWLFLNKKLNHWKSTRATAEVIYALIHYLDREGNLGQRESATVQIGDRTRTFDFDPDRYTGANTQWVVSGEEIDSRLDSGVVVEKKTAGLMFASATWHFSTEELPQESRGDFFSVDRAFYRRSSTAEGWVLQPLLEGDALEIGDQVEVQLSLRTRHGAEYVHLRDPRGAGFEPVAPRSSYKWDLGIGWYEEIRDSGTNFFFDRLPVGEYTFKYRLRVAMAGEFRIAPAVVQSMYAPEFTAYSAGATIEVAN